MPHVGIAQHKDGSAAYLSRSRKAMFTQRRNWAWVMTEDDAEETVSRLNGVIALGQCHQNVDYFRHAPTRRRKRCSTT